MTLGLGYEASVCRGPSITPPGSPRLSTHPRLHKIGRKGERKRKREGEVREVREIFAPTYITISCHSLTRRGHKIERWRNKRSRMLLFPSWASLHLFYASFTLTYLPPVGVEALLHLTLPFYFSILHHPASSPISFFLPPSLPVCLSYPSRLSRPCHPSTRITGGLCEGVTILFSPPWL